MLVWLFSEQDKDCNEFSLRRVQLSVRIICDIIEHGRNLRGNVKNGNKSLFRSKPHSFTII
jgi:hypothetical protein